MPARDAAALLHRIDGTKLALDHDEGREHEHEHKDDAGHDQQNKTDRHCKHQQNGRAEKLPERARMPQYREVDCVGIVVRGEIEGGRTHVDERAASEVDQGAG